MSNKLIAMLEERIEKLEELAAEAYSKLLKEMKGYSSAEYIGEYSNNYVRILSQIEYLEEWKDEIEK